MHVMLSVELLLPLFLDLHAKHLLCSAPPLMQCSLSVLSAPSGEAYFSPLISSNSAHLLLISSKCSLSLFLVSCSCSCSSPLSCSGLLSLFLSLFFWFLVLFLLFCSVRLSNLLVR
jgi:hypothetical protein